MDLLTPTELASKLRLTRVTVYRLVNEHRLPVVIIRQGKRRILRFRASDIDAFITPTQAKAHD